MNHRRLADCNLTPDAELEYGVILADLDIARDRVAQAEDRMLGAINNGASSAKVEWLEAQFNALAADLHTAEERLAMFESTHLAAADVATAEANVDAVVDRAIEYELAAAGSGFTPAQHALFWVNKFESELARQRAAGMKTDELARETQLQRATLWALNEREWLEARLEERAAIEQYEDDTRAGAELMGAA